MNDKYGPKSSKMAVEDEQEEALDLSIKKQRIDKGEQKFKQEKFNPLKQDDRLPWGSLQFYESGKPVFSELLRGDDPIEINTNTILFAKPAYPQDSSEKTYPNPIMKYTDWLHVIGNFLIEKFTSS